MKKILLSAVLLLAGICSMNAQDVFGPPPPGPGPKCDSMSVDSIKLNIGMSSLEVYLNNISEYWVAYPQMEGALEPNPYVALSTQPATSSILTAQGTTMFSIQVDSLMPADSVPAGTVFTGQVHLFANDDTSLNCNYGFTFTYGNKAPLSINKVSKRQLLVSANSERLLLRGELENATMQLISITGQVVWADTHRYSADTRSINIANLPTGMYFIAILHNNETLVRRFIKE